MSILKEFVDWKVPLLHSVRDYLLARYSTQYAIDLSLVTLAFPGRRAGRRLIELLVEASKEKALPLYPPRIITTGSLPELFIGNSQEVISDTERVLLFCEAVMNSKDTALRVLFPHSNDKNEFRYYHTIAQYVDSVYVEIEAAALGFSDILKLISGEVCEQRFRSLDLICNMYFEILKNRKKKDRFQIRREFLESPKSFLMEQVYLVGTSDINQITKKILSKVSNQVVSFINAPESKSYLFDEYGCVNPDRFKEEVIAFDKRDLILANSYTDEAAAVLQIIGEFSQESHFSNISIGIGDEKRLPFIEEKLFSRGIETRRVTGNSLSQSSPYRVLSSLKGLLSYSDSIKFGSVIRQPYLLQWISNKINENERSILDAFDEYQEEFLQADLFTTELLGGNKGVLVHKVIAVIKELTKDLSGRDIFSSWALKFSNLIRKLYGEIERSRLIKSDSEIIEFCEISSEVLSQLSNIDFPIKTNVSEFLQIFLERISKTSLSPTANETAIELLGWLELQQDDAEYVVATGFNEGMIPESVTEDPLLPDSLRNRIGLSNNSIRYARDAYALLSLMNSRRSLKVTLTKYDPSGNSLNPSRLLLSVKSEELPSRVLELIQEGQAYENDVSSFGTKTITPFSVTKDTSIISAISVTSFKDYIFCPFRFYLSKILKLKSKSDKRYELDALKFGNFTHEILLNFAKSAYADSHNTIEIHSYVTTELNRRFLEHFGSSAYPALNVQRELLIERLKGWADSQADWVKEGWRIKYSELAFNKGDFVLDLNDGRSISIVGRIDRIDFNSSTNEWAVIDYKTNKNEEDPTKAHYTSKKGWINLQLPLYYYFLREFGLSGDIKLGYFNIPEDTSKAGILMTKWREEELSEALVKAKQISKEILNRKFWPPTDKTPTTSDYESIVDEVLSRQECTAFSMRNLETDQ
ncbi:MAG: PD-(D/E)XK nuclease family protein [bacterium]|nr:PD-(D/E)XK nuclease family protein [bacterium]